jgi:murein DD-endopeptidase MepM/ murein hydrolase activator NlpD
MKKRYILITCLSVILVIGFLLPQDIQMPVKGASSNSYHPKSYWAYPWGKSITHKGVDIFAKKGTEIKSATNAFVLLKGFYYPAGNFVVTIGPKWRFHYYAHLHEIHTTLFSFLTRDSVIGTVGDTGNAKGKQHHLHYVIATPFPYFWRLDRGVQGWMKMFILNPIPYLKAYEIENK